jgi:hypothetical protein
MQNFAFCVLIGLFVFDYFRISIIKEEERKKQLEQNKQNGTLTDNFDDNESNVPALISPNQELNLKVLYCTS